MKCALRESKLRLALRARRQQKNEKERREKTAEGNGRRKRKETKSFSNAPELAGLALSTLPFRRNWGDRTLRSNASKGEGKERKG